ncbi:4-alpha-glucanotransferase [Ranunculus cassubicifolius]
MCEDMKNKGHVLLLPLPLQGHINPMLQFGKRLVSKGLKTTLATTVYLSKSMHMNHCKVGIETISDGFDETGPLWSQEIYFLTLKEVGSRTLGELIKKFSCSNEPITGLVCDSNLSWGLDVGKEFGLVTAHLYTQPCGVSSIFYHIYKGSLSVPVKESTVYLPGLPPLALHDLPSSVVTGEERDMRFLLGQFSNVNKADWLLFNTFDDLESEIVKWMGSLWRVRTIGPTTPSMYLDKPIEGDMENSICLFKPSEGNYLKWLNAKETGSVLYIAFGSLAELGEQQMQEIIRGIKKSGKDFLWVVRETEQSKLPEGFIEEMVEKGLIVPWCSQLEVLDHEAIGCFLTHCGWNSTIEALSLGVPMVAMPQIWDQLTNAKFIEDVWKIGLRVMKDDKGIVRGEELQLCIKEIMEGERGKLIKTNASRWKELAKNAMDAGGSSDLNIEEFVTSVTYI